MLLTFILVIVRVVVVFSLPVARYIAQAPQLDSMLTKVSKFFFFGPFLLPDVWLVAM